MSDYKHTHSNTSHHKKDYTPLHIVFAVIVLVADALMVFVLMNATQFSNLSGVAFIAANIICTILILITNILLMLGIRTKKKQMFIPGAVFAVLFVAIGIYGTYAITRVNSSLNKMTSATTTESVSTSLVVYAEDGNQEYTDVAQLDGKIVGIATGTNTATLGQNRLESEGVTVSYTEYQDYSSELLALFNGEIDCAVLPTNYQSMFANETSLTALLENTTSLLDFEESVTIENTSGTDKDLTSEPFTVLLIGNADGLSDTMILCSVNPISMKVTMTSIARDSYVPITCYNGGYSKLNAAHAVSRDCTIATIEQLTGVDIDYYVDTNFKGVVEVVDALGGITVDSPVEFVGQNSDSERGSYTVWVPAGDNVRLDGEQALAFARERHLFASGDFARQAHQQEVIEAIAREIMRTRDINTLLDVLDAAGDNIQTNLTVSQMTGFMSYALQKCNRYYDQEHPEKVFDIEGWRITGYSSGLWDEGLQMSLYIYRLWDGSIADTKEAIDRNIDLNSTITPMTQWQWSVNWEFESPTISNDVYDEVIVESDVPTTLSNYVGRDIGVLQSFCNTQGITLGITYIQDSNYANGVITYQDVAEGTALSDVYAINVTVVDNTTTTTTVTCWDGSTAESESACPAYVTCSDGSYAASESACPTATPTATPTETATATPTPTPTATPTPACGTNATWDANTNACVCNADTPYGDPTSACKAQDVCGEGYEADGSGGCKATAVPETPATEATDSTATQSADSSSNEESPQT